MPKYFTQNILELDPPDGDQLERIEFLARALAYGVINNLWTPKFAVYQLYDTGNTFYTMNAKQVGEKWEGVEGSYSESYDYLTGYLDDKWGRRQPLASFLEAFQYFIKLEVEGASVIYMLAPKAFDLLKQPSTASHVFISYKRGMSSTFALLIEARLKIAGNSNVFVDKNIRPGENWHGRLREQIEQCEVFICLVAPGTLESEWVQKEIGWAIELGKRVISVWHGCEIIQDISITQTQAIQVTGESADDYEMAVIRLLNSLGYATY